MTTCRVYELPGVRHVTGSTIRPGGLALTRRAVAAAGLPAGAPVLDIGCGAGATADYLRDLGLRSVGLDPSVALLRQGRERSPGLVLSRGRGEALPFGAGTFAAVVAECCLSLMEEPAQAVAEFGRVLEPAGTLILSDMLARRPAGQPAARHLPISCCVGGAFTRVQITSLLEDAGFQIRLWEDHTEALKQLAVQIIWEYGSLENFWHCTGATGSGGAQTVAALRPGYFLLLAHYGGGD